MNKLSSRPNIFESTRPTSICGGSGGGGCGAALWDVERVGHFLIAICINLCSIMPIQD